jgi:hypothetical protein
LRERVFFMSTEPITGPTPRKRENDSAPHPKKPQGDSQ